MAARRSRIKLKPNLGAKVRGPAVSSALPKDPVSEASDIPAKQDLRKPPDDLSSASTTATTCVEKGLVNSIPVKLDTGVENTSVKCLKIEENQATQDVNPASPTTIGAIVPTIGLVGISRITPITTPRDVPGEEKRVASESESDGGETVKPVQGLRVRNRFAKARPNLTAEAAIRGRIRTNSMSALSDDESLRSPPVVNRLTVGRPRQPSLSEATPCIPVPPEKIEKEPTPTKPSVPEPVRIPNYDNSLGIDMGCAVVKRVIKYERDEDGNKKKPKKLKWIDGPIDKSKLTMRDLIHMNPMGKPMKSSLEDKEIKRKQKELKREAREKEDDTASLVSTATLQEERDEQVLENDAEESANMDEQPKTAPKPDPEEEELMAVPQVRIGQNGEIILNESSLFIDNKDPDADSKAAAMELVHETDYTSSTFAYGRKTASRIWSEMETKKFYLALSAVGTDFSLMNNLFPKRTRTELKRKFKREEKTNRYLVDKAIQEQQHFDQEFFDNLCALEIDESKPRKRQSKSKSQEGSGEDETESGSKENKKKKVKSEKDEDGVEKVKKKRGRPRKVKEGEEKQKVKEGEAEAEAEGQTVEMEGQAEVETEEPVIRPKRKASKKSKGLTYLESDDEDTDGVLVIDLGDNAEATQEPSCSGEIEQQKANKPKRGRKPKLPKVEKEDAPKPKRRRTKKDENKDNIKSINVELNSSVTEQMVTAVASEADVENASYVFVASSPDLAGEAEPVIHVYLVSPTGGETRQPPKHLDDVDKVSYHPTPSSIQSPKPMTVPTSFLAASSKGTAVSSTSNVEENDEETAESRVDVMKTQCNSEEVISENLLINEMDNEGNNTVASLEGHIVNPLIVEDIIDQSTDLVEKDNVTTDIHLMQNAQQLEQTESDNSVRVTKDTKSELTENVIEIQKLERKSSSEIVHNVGVSTSMTAPDRNDKPTEEVTGSDKSLAVKGRRRRITAMPKLPAGKRRPAVGRSKGQTEPKIDRPAAGDELPLVIDEVTAGQILMEMSTL